MSAWHWALVLLGLCAAGLNLRTHNADRNKWAAVDRRLDDERMKHWRPN